LWLFSLNRANIDSTNSKEESLKRARYGLWPAFINGWLDALPPGAKLVDGMEDSYYFAEDTRFAQVYSELKASTARYFPLCSNLKTASSIYLRSPSVSRFIPTLTWLNRPPGTIWAHVPAVRV
jgi:hypothetical protein